MKPALAYALPALAALLASRAALAQGPSLPPDSEVAPPSPPAAAGAVAVPCRLVDNRGVDDADAETATRLLCSEIAQAGAPRGARYRIAFGTLGSLIIVSVDREGRAPGAVADSRSMTLHGIEELTVAAPRLADSIVHASPIAETMTVDNVVGEEARVPLSRPSTVYLGVGLDSAFAPYEGLGVAPALVLDVHYGMSQLEVGASLRLGNPGSWASNASVLSASTIAGLASLSVGARYFTSNKDISPYLGAGVGYEYFRLALPTGFDGDGSGFGAYVDAGVELFRTRRSRFALGARFDLPFFTLHEGLNFWPTPSSPSPSSTFYFAPLSVEARLTF